MTLSVPTASLTATLLVGAFYFLLIFLFLLAMSHGEASSRETLVTGAQTRAPPPSRDARRAGRLLTFGGLGRGPWSGRVWLLVAGVSINN